MGGALAKRALVLLDSGRREEMPALVDKVLTLQDEQGALYYIWLVDLAWALVALGREEEMPTAGRGGVWLEAGELIVRGEFDAAAAILEEAGLGTDAAYARLRTAEQLADAGRHAEAKPHLDRALAFYRGVGATRYVRRAEALLPASA